jgi:hypothetical protein
MRPTRLLLVLLLLPAIGAAQRNAPDTTRCFRFDRAYFGYPPNTTPVLALTPARHPEPRLGTEGHVIELPTLRPDSAERVGRQLYSGWAPLREDSVIVVWRNAFAGYRMRLAVRGDSLVGIARFNTDQRDRTTRPGRARAVRVACPESS